MMSKRPLILVLLLIVVSAGVAVPLAAEGGGCFEAGDIERLTYIGDVEISPDGEMVAYVLNAYHQPLGAREAIQQDIWVAYSDERRDPFPYVSGPRREGFPRWSPDGSRLAFLSDRDGTSQVYIIYTSGGEAEKLTSIDGDITSFSWSPDGERMAAVIRESEDSLTAEERKKGDDEIVMSELYKNSRLWIIDSAEGIGARATGADIHVHSANWSPDGSKLAMIVSDDSGSNSSYYHSRLEIMEVATGARAVLSERASGEAMFSPDGKKVLFAYPEEHAPVTVSVGLVSVINADGSGLKVLGRNYLGTLRVPKWHPDGERLLVFDIEGVRGWLAYLSVEDDETDRIAELKIPYYMGKFYDISDDGSKIATIRSEGLEPPQLWMIEEKLFGGSKRLTKHNGWIDERELPASRIVNWTSRDGTKIEGVVLLPPGYQKGRRYPAVLVIHGGPMWAWWHGWHGSWHDWGVPLACRGYVVLLPNPRGSIGYGTGFARANFKDWGGGDFEDVLAGADFLVKEGYTDPGHIGICGWSYGGFMTAWAVTQTDLFRAAVVGAGVTNLYSFHGTTDITPDFLKQYFEDIAYRIPDSYENHSPVYQAEGAATPTLILHGEKDARVPVGQAYELYRALKQNGAETELVVYPREGHAFREICHQKDVLRRIEEWFGEYLKEQ